MSRPVLLAAALLSGATFAACAQGGAATPDAGQPAIDAGHHRRDAGRDAGSHAGRDAGHDAGHDSGTVIADAGRDAGPPPTPDAGHDAGPAPPCTPTPSNLAIVEVMIESRTGSGDLGEWFEIENIGSCTVNLTGLIVESPTDAGAAVTHTVSVGVVPPGERFVFAQSGDSAENHGLPVDYVYGSGTAGVVFNNGADSLRLTYGGVEIDRVTWGSTDFRVGASRQLSSTASPTSNDSLASGAWCDSTDVYSMATGGPYRGTPGTANAACP